MKPTIKTILINGKKVKCRALNAGRPLKPKAAVKKKAAVKIKPVKAWIKKSIFESSASPFQVFAVSEWANTFCPKSSFRRNYVQVLITPLKKGSK